MVKDPWTYKKRKRPLKRVLMQKTIGTQTSPEKFLPEHWNPTVILQKLTMSRMPNGQTSQNIVLNHEPIVDKAENQYKDNIKAPKISRLPNNYNIFVRPITNNEKANSTLSGGLLSQSDETPTYKVTRRCKPGPKCYKRLHQPFLAEFDIPLARNDDNSNNSLNNSLTVIQEQEEVTEMGLTNCENEEAPVLDVSSGNGDIIDHVGFSGFTELLENPSDALIEAINQGMVDTNSPTQEPISEGTQNKEASEESTENTGDPKRRRNKTVTFEFRDVQTEIVENGEEPTAPNEENDSMEDEGVENPLKKRKYIRIFAEKVNIYNHFYN